ncbi:MAG: SUMF1/EgtB/PvdO family nonheme iron enzyme [Spirochaetaceae bacterium]|nr:SUMF1/EgtB/PvdO family nonheme iron enzyme [Spirochaetaceae bacterium]
MLESNSLHTKSFLCYVSFSMLKSSFSHGASSGSNRVSRGGSWIYDASPCRSANRFSNTPSLRGYNLGFRFVLRP